MIACPSCKRRIITRRDILLAPLDGTAQCRACGSHARLDVFSRWVLSCLLAVTLPALLLAFGIFYSGHLLLFSMIVIVAAWRAMAWMGLPFLSLEPMPTHTPLDRRQSTILLGALLVTAMLLDAFIASKFESEQAMHDAEAPRSAQHLQH